MADSLVIVAVPDENDRVWKVSSEEVPHLTLLYLGEDASQVSNVDQIVLFVEHAANTMLHRFYLTVDRRGELGDDKADVLFFQKNRYDLKTIRDFRNALLQDANIRKAYDAAAQFNGPWLPHLTLGYPETPAKVENDDDRFYDIQFNKIQVWLGDSEGPEFLLKDYWDEADDAMETVPMDVAMSDLSHAAKVSDTAWSKFKDSDYTDEQYARACLLDRGEGTAKSRYSIPVREPEGTLNRNACHAAAAVLSSKGGAGSARGNKVNASSEQIAAARKKLVALYNGPLNEEVPEGLGGEKRMAQTVDLGEAFLNHHGTKGMKWGVRKENVASRARSVGRAAKSTGGAVGKAAGSTSRFFKDVNFENRVESGKAREAVVAASHSPFVKKDLPAVKARHGDYGKLKNRAKKPFSKEARAYRKDAKETYIKRLETTANETKNASGTRQYTIRERGIEQPAQGGALPRSRYYWDISSRSVEHANGDADFTRLEVLMDDGFITGLKKVDADDTMAQTVELGEEFLSHYGKKGMKWGVRKEDLPSETKREGIQKFIDPQGHSLNRDVGKTVVGIAIPIVAPLTVPAQIRLVRGGIRGTKAKIQDNQNKKFERVAKSQKGFVAIHNGAHDHINRGIEATNKKYPMDLTKNPSKKKEYDNEILKVMQDGYRDSANRITNKRGDRHVDLEFANDGMDFKIHVKEGPPKPTIERVKHAAVDDETVTFSGKIKRAPTGHILDLEFDDFEKKTVTHTVELGEEFLSHYGTKGMKWGVRNTTRRNISIGRNRPAPVAVAPTATSKVPRGSRRKTKIAVEGGENHPAHDDAIKIARAQAKLKKSGTAALSNQELREVQDRLNLERNVTQLVGSTSRVGKGKKFVKDFTGLNKDINETVRTGHQTTQLPIWGKRPKQSK